MKSFKTFIKEEPEDENWADPSEWLDAYYESWCKENPNHQDCRDHLKRKGAKK
jgi:hypothetical protein